MNRPWYHRLLQLAVPLLFAAALVLAALARLTGLWTGQDNYAGKTLLINEVCARNLTGLTDADGDASDWIELRNVSGQDLVLDGYTLSDNPDNPDKWTFPEGTVIQGQGSYIMVIFADGKDGRDAAGNLHTNFRLAGEGETLILCDPDGNVVDTLEYPEQDYDMTYGRCLNSALRTGRLAVATPGRDNPADFWEEDAATADFGTVRFSAPAGFYEQPFSLTLEADDPDAVILYTLDGSTPDVDSPVYTGAIPIESRSDDPNAYLTLPCVLYDGWLMNYAYEYGANPASKGTTVTVRLYKDGVLGEAVQAATYWVGVEPHTLPVVSVTTQADKLFGADGIYTAGYTYYTQRKYGTENAQGNFNSGRAVSANLQVLLPDGTLALQDEISLQVSGGWSRGSALLKNLNVKLKNQQTDLLSGAMNADALDGFVLRGSGNGTVYPSLHQDAFLNNYLYDQDIGTQYNMPVVLYLEDEYWGVYTIREKKNGDFFERHYGIREKNLISPGITDHPANQEEKYSFGAGVDALDCTTAEGMAWVEENLDLDEYIRYIIAQMYVYNSDGLYNGGNNTILWKTDTVDPDNPYADGRWHFLLNDLDCTLIDVTVDPFAYLLEGDFSLANCETAPWYSVVDNLFQKLWQSEDFRARFRTVFEEEMATTYVPENLLPAFEDWADLLRPEIEADLARQEVKATALAPLAEALLDTEVTGWSMTPQEWEEDLDVVREYFAHRADVMLYYLNQYDA